MKESKYDSEHKLVKATNRLIRRMDRYVSYRHVFLRGIVNGVGTFIGATIVAGILIGLLSSVINFAERLEPVKNFFDGTQIDEVVENSNISGREN